MIWWWVVGVGGCGGLGEYLGVLVGGVVLLMFGGDVIGLVLGVGVLVFGYYCCVLVVMVVGWVGFWCWDVVVEVV